MGSRHESMLRVHHVPTGEIVTVTQPPGLSPHSGRLWVESNQARCLALRRLRSRVWARMQGYERSAVVVASYNLPDDDPYPYDLTSYRSRP